MLTAEALSIGPVRNQVAAATSTVTPRVIPVFCTTESIVITAPVRS